VSLADRTQDHDLKADALSAADLPAAAATNAPPPSTHHRKAEFGQFMTPPAVARFMASLFPASDVKVCRLIDPGAGKGSLTGAFLDRWAAGEFRFSKVEVCAYEIDPNMRIALEESLASYAARLPIRTNVIAGDFIEHGAKLC
jgi:16S rRNA A1518/A1519 N6-dimethyltransferase RsmA/KsgA/DIM1 with predicted DNA glycosylase/AP lyase activity